MSGHHRHSYDKKGRIVGIALFDRNSIEYKNGYCASLDVTSGGCLELWTDGKYRFFPNKAAIRVLEGILKKLRELSE